MSSSSGVPYLGSKISLISKSEIRYEGILYTIDTKDSTVALAKVRSYGTEDRPTDRPVAPRDETYEYIIFRGADIKDIRVCQPPKPQPTLEGGLPNDPAIVQHSATAPMGGGSAPGSQKTAAPIGSSSYGPIGSSSYPGSGQAPGGTPFGSGQAPGPQPQISRFSTASSSPTSTFPTVEGRPSSQQADEGQTRPGGSPVMDILNRDHQSGRSSPLQSGAGESKSLAGQDGRNSNRGRGSSSGFYRGGRGRGGNQGGNQGFRGGRGGGGQGGGSNRGGGFQPGRPTATKKEPLKFEGEYDFDKANEEFKEVLDKLQKSTLETTPKEKNGDAEVEEDLNNEEVEEGEIDTPVPGESPIPEVFYDKKKSFFDSISCEAMEKSKGRSNRPDWKAEKKLNRETFGVAGNIGRRGYNRRGGGGGYGGGYNRGSGGGGYHRGGGYNSYGGGGRGGYGGQNQGYGGHNQGYGGHNQGYGGQNQGYGGGQGYNNGYNGRFARDGGQNYRGGRGRGGWDGQQQQRGQHVEGGGGGHRGTWRTQHEEQ